MYLLAYDWGSIIKAHLLLFSIIIPFSMDVSSFGSPDIFHYWMCTSSPRKLRTVTVGEKTSSYSVILSLQLLSSLYLYWLVKAPQYATVPAAMIASPCIKSPIMLSVTISFVQRSFSSLSPSVSFYALSNLTSNSRIFLANYSYSACLALNEAYSY